MSACCPDCQAMNRTPRESVHFHALLAQQLAAKARAHADRAVRWSAVALVLFAVTLVLLIVGAVAS